MPSSKDRRRVELPTYLYERLQLIAESEERAVTSLLHELLQVGLKNYQPTWIPRHFMERFNQQARQALDLAKDEAKQLGQTYIGTEHLLLGLLREQEGIAAQVLRQLWIDLDKMRAGVAYIAKNAASLGAPATLQAKLAARSDGEITFTPRARKVLALAVDEAQRLGHDYVGAEHLLLALAREGEGIAAGLLQTFGALGKVREFTLAALDRRSVDAVHPAAETQPESTTNPPTAQTRDE